jgi:hypothetical protein
MTTSARSNSEFAAELLNAAGARRTPRQPYSERWLNYPFEVRLRLAGNWRRLAGLDRLAALPADERAEVAAAAADRMRQVVRRLEDAKTLVDELRAERNALMIEQAILGAQQSHIAETASVTAMMVSHALATAAPRVKKPRL